MSLTTTLAGEEHVRLQPQPSVPAIMSKWPEPHLSIGPRCHPLGRNQCWEVIGPARDISKAIFDATRVLLNSRSDYVNEGEREQCMVIFGLYMIGKNEVKACPTLLFSCERKGPRRRAIELAKSEELLKAFPPIKLAESSRPPQSLEPPMLLGIEAREDDNDPIASWIMSSSNEVLGSSEILHVPNQHVCGTIIVAENGFGTNTARVATLGGIICSRGKLFGLTAAHVFKSGYDPTHLTTQCDTEFAFDAESDQGSDDEQDLVAMSSEGSISSASESSAMIPKKRGGVRPAGRDTSYLSDTTLPTDNSPSNADMEPYMKKLGKLLYVSGNDSADWALIKIEYHANASENLITWQENGQRKSLQPRRIATKVPSGHDVVLATGLNGVLEGKISETPSYVLLPQSLTFQEAWTVRLNSVLTKGNSGTWVVDAHNGDLFGHIIAGHPKSTLAYMLSADTIFSQLEKVFGEKFELPTTGFSDTRSSTTSAPAIDIAPTPPNAAELDSWNLHLTIVDIISSIDLSFEALMISTRAFPHDSDISSFREELKLLHRIFQDLGMATRIQQSESMTGSQRIRQTGGSDWYAFESGEQNALLSFSCSTSPVDTAKQLLMKEILSVVQSSLENIKLVIERRSKVGPKHASEGLHEFEHAASIANPNQDLKFVQSSFHILKQMLSTSPGLETTPRTENNLSEGETNAHSETIGAVNIIYNSLGLRKINLSLSPILARLGETAANRADGNFQVQTLPDSPLQPQNTTTLTITELEVLLGKLGLKVPIPHFDASDVLNKPLDIGRCYFADILNNLFDDDPKKVYSSIRSLDDVFNGDLAVVLPKLKPGFKPNEFAFSLITKFPPRNPLFSLPFADGFQLRVMFKRQALSRIVLPYIQDRKETYGCDVSPGLLDTASPNLGKKKLVIEFSSPNIASGFQGKHLRSTVIGSFISKLYESMGWDVSKINYLGDWGMPIGLLGAGWERYGSEEQFEADPIVHLLEVYNKINKEFIPTLIESKRILNKGGDPAEFEGKGLFAERNAFFKRIEDGEEKANRFWRRVRKVNIANYTKLYAYLNISFDEYSGESQVSPAIMTEVEEILKSKGICDYVEGTWLIDLKKHTGRSLGTAIIRGRTGTGTYLLRELAAAIERHRKYKFDKMIYVVAADQHTTHFPRVFKILELAGMADLASKLQWVNFSSQSEGYMLADILDQYQAAMEDSLKENPEKSLLLGDTDKEALAAIGTTALLAQELLARRANNHVFDISQMTSFVKGTGPDLQYWYAKLCSLLNPCHATLDLSDKDYASIEGEEQSNLLRYLIQYPDITHTAFETLESAVIMSYLSNVTLQLSNCLDEIEDGTSLTPAQVMLYEVTRRVLENGMKVLGIKPATKLKAHNWPTKLRR